MILGVKNDPQFGPMLLADELTEEQSIFKEGYICLDDPKPGFGITMREEKIRQYQREPFYHIR
jgi:L-alanine-DL-glutamate epimerase-like enolase superfamily enzyme